MGKRVKSCPDAFCCDSVAMETAAFVRVLCVQPLHHMGSASQTLQIMETCCHNIALNGVAWIMKKLFFLVVINETKQSSSMPVLPPIFCRLRVCWQAGSYRHQKADPWSCTEKNEYCQFFFGGGEIKVGNSVSAVKTVKRIWRSFVMSACPSPEPIKPLGLHTKSSSVQGWWDCYETDLESKSLDRLLKNINLQWALKYDKSAKISPQHIFIFKPYVSNYR